jgi:hypothetical protein
MRIVKLTRDMRPSGRAGADIVLPDEKAAELVESGEAEDSRPFPPPDVAPAKPVRAPIPEKKGYMTRKGG